MKYIFDTNVCINILNGRNENILNKIDNINNYDVIIPSIVRFELFYGAFKSNKLTKTLKILNEFLNSFETIGFNNNIAEIAGKIRADLDKKGTPIGPYDLIIGATAIYKDLVLVTHNTKEFSRIDKIKIEDWEIF